MKPPPFLYLRPTSLAEAQSYLAEHGDKAKLLAGGQSLVPLLNFRLARPAVLVDLALIDELVSIQRRDGYLTLGSMVRQRAAELSPEVRAISPLVVEALSYVGHIQIRNRGTVGGSIAHADPAAELPAAALALDAEMVAQSSRGTRVIPSAEFFTGPFTTVLASDEILTEIRVPTVDGARTTFTEVARRRGDFALGGVAIRLLFAPNTPVVKDARVVAIGMGLTPLRLPAVESLLLGRSLDPALRREAGALAASEVRPSADAHADAQYRRELIATLVARGLKRVAA